MLTEVDKLQKLCVLCVCACVCVCVCVRVCVCVCVYFETLSTVQLLFKVDVTLMYMSHTSTKEDNECRRVTYCSTTLDPTTYTVVSTSVYNRGSMAATLLIYY